MATMSHALRDVMFLAEMDARLRDAACPPFTVSEVARWYALVQGLSLPLGEHDGAFVLGYCLRKINDERDDSCFYK
jgi:hypothetical protein